MGEMPRSWQTWSRICTKACNSAEVAVPGMETDSDFLRRILEPAARGLRSENVNVQPSCNTLWIEHAHASGAFPPGKNSPISAKQWERVGDYKRQELGIWRRAFGA